ncbi:MAG: DNA translocase FtsK, partial [Treponema sp.]|nr:DNA translocase FtsK [Treponema sp.]
MRPIYEWEACVISAFFDELKKLKNGVLSKYRMAALVAAAVLGIFALALGLSLMGAVFGIKAFNPALGSFFSQAYGILSLFIPIYLGYAALILADPRWRPDRLFILAAALFPFLTLTLGFICIRDFDALAGEFFFLDLTGKTGFGLIIIVLTLLEVAAIQMLKSSLFGKIKDGGHEEKTLHKKQGLLPPPDRIDETADLGEWVDARKFRAMDENLPLVAEGEPSGEWEINLNLPAMRPLHTPLALEYLDEIRREQEAADDGEQASDCEYTIDSDHADDSVERALEEAELVAALHSEQARKKSSGKTSPHFSRKKYHVPADILNQYPDGEYWVIDQATRDAAVILRETLEEFKIKAEVTGIRKGPVITMFEILPAPGVKLSRIVNLQDNIALRLAASSIRIVAPIPGKHAVGIEVPNAKRNIVSFREIIEGELQREGKKPEIPVVMGKDITGEAQTIDLTQTPHLLIAGATGAGKSVCVNSMILSILYQLSPADCRLILIDPKIVELKLYNDIPHLLTPVITEPKRAFQALQYCIYEMERRYACLDSMGVRDIRNYNKR